MADGHNEDTPSKSEAAIHSGSRPKRLQYALKFIGAALSNMIASCISNPFDVIKVRQQLLRQKPGSKANASWQLGIRIIQTEGPVGLMTGLTASMMREITYSGIRLGSYEYIRDSLFDLSRGSLTHECLTLKVLAAAVAAVFAGKVQLMITNLIPHLTFFCNVYSTIANPTDLVKVRMQAYYPNSRPYHNTLQAFIAVYKEGTNTQTSTTSNGSIHSFKSGIQSLYRGVQATSLRGMVASSSQISSYCHVKQIIKSRRLMEEGIELHLTAGLASGLACSMASNPFDVIKVRLMNDKERRLNGIVDCFRKTVTREGPLAFYKGFGMCWTRISVHSIVSFLTFEQFRVLVGLAPL